MGSALLPLYLLRRLQKFSADGQTTRHLSSDAHTCIHPPTRNPGKLTLKATQMRFGFLLGGTRPKVSKHHSPRPCLEYIIVRCVFGRCTGSGPFMCLASASYWLWNLCFANTSPHRSRLLYPLLAVAPNLAEPGGGGIVHIDVCMSRLYAPFSFTLWTACSCSGLPLPAAGDFSANVQPHPLLREQVLAYEAHEVQLWFARPGEGFS